MAEHSGRLALTPGRQRLVGLAAAAIVVAAIAGLVVLPTGASSAEGVVPAGARVEARSTVQGARVLLLSRGARQQLMVAYHRDEGWHGVAVTAPPAGATAAWAATRGGAGVPAFSAVYGRGDGARVQVAWSDGQSTESAIADGAYLLIRPGHLRSKSVTVLAADGSVKSKVDGP